MEYVFIGWVFSFIEAPELLGSIMTTRANQRICLRFHSHVLFGRQLVPCVQVEWELAFSISMCAALIPMTEFIYFNAAPNSLSNICRHILLLFLGWTRPAHSVFRSLADDDCNCARIRVFFFVCSETALSCCRQPPVPRPLKWINERPCALPKECSAKVDSKNVCTKKLFYVDFLRVNYFTFCCSCIMFVQCLHSSLRFLDVNEGRAGSVVASVCRHLPAPVPTMWLCAGAFCCHHLPSRHTTTMWSRMENNRGCNWIEAGMHLFVANVANQAIRIAMNAANTKNWHHRKDFCLAADAFSIFGPIAAKCGSNFGVDAFPKIVFAINLSHVMWQFFLASKLDESRRRRIEWHSSGVSTVPMGTRAHCTRMRTPSNQHHHQSTPRTGAHTTHSHTRAHTC